MEHSKYADTCIWTISKSANDEITLAADVESANHILLLASLPTHKFVSYSAKTLAKYPPERLGMKDKISILGIMWNWMK